jgi:hypothetical protein
MAQLKDAYHIFVVRGNFFYVFEESVGYAMNNLACGDA